MDLNFHRIRSNDDVINLIRSVCLVCFCGSKKKRQEKQEKKKKATVKLIASSKISTST